MDRFKNILVAASPGHLEPMTLRAAVNLADTNNSRLTVLDVMPPVHRLRKKVAVEGLMVDVEAALLRDREERLRHTSQAKHRRRRESRRAVSGGDSPRAGSRQRPGNGRRTRSARG